MAFLKLFYMAMAIDCVFSSYSTNDGGKKVVSSLTVLADSDAISRLTEECGDGFHSPQYLRRMFGGAPDEGDGCVTDSSDDKYQCPENASCKYQEKREGNNNKKNNRCEDWEDICYPDYSEFCFKEYCFPDGEDESNHESCIFTDKYEKCKKKWKDKCMKWEEDCSSEKKCRVFFDCECDNGYIKDLNEKKCVKDSSFGCDDDDNYDYECPYYSSPKDDMDCVNTFEDCECDDGYIKHKSEKKCIKDKHYQCDHNYECPYNSSPKDGVDCIKDFNDCDCDDGFIKHTRKKKCIKEDDSPDCDYHYKCPRHSRSKDDVTCVKSFDDCECDDGFIKHKSEKKCVKDDYTDCDDEYVCPYHSTPKDDIECIENFHHCECDEGYIKHKKKKKCIKDDDDDDDDDDYCDKYFKCPYYSHPKDGVYCVKSFNDCECDDGFIKHKRRKKCVKAYSSGCYGRYRCPYHSSPKSGVKCVKNFGDCNCDDGFIKHKWKKKCIVDKYSDYDRHKKCKDVPKFTTCVDRWSDWCKEWEYICDPSDRTRDYTDYCSDEHCFPPEGDNKDDLVSCLYPGDYEECKDEWKNKCKKWEIMCPEPRHRCKNDWC